jgi:hypothetical protein
LEKQIETFWVLLGTFVVDFSGFVVPVVLLAFFMLLDGVFAFHTNIFCFEFGVLFLVRLGFWLCN